MAFGNATIGDLKKIAGGGGGGAKDYNSLSNKPSINGTELLAGTEIGKLSGNIKVGISALDNVSITNAVGGQALLLNALSGKWENGNISNVTITSLFTAVDSSQLATIELSESYANFDLIIMQGFYSDSSNRYSQSAIFAKSTLDDILNHGGYFGIANNVGYLGYTLADNDTLTKYESSGSGYYISQIIGIKF